MERVICFECNETFELEDRYKLDYEASGLCPKCFGKVLDYGFEEKTLEKLDAIIENMKLMNTILLKWKGIGK